jgi:hypothetical protein
MNDVYSFLQSLQESTEEYLKMFYNRSIPNNSHIPSHTVYLSLTTTKIFMNELMVGLVNTCKNLINIYKYNLHFFVSATEEK